MTTGHSPFTSNGEKLDAFTENASDLPVRGTSHQNRFGLDHASEIVLGIHSHVKEERLAFNVENSGTGRVACQRPSCLLRAFRWSLGLQTRFYLRRREMSKY